MLTQQQIDSGLHSTDLDGRLIFRVCTQCWGLLTTCPDPSCEDELHHYENTSQCRDGVKPKLTPLQVLTRGVFGAPKHEPCYFSVLRDDSDAYLTLEYDSVEQAEAESQGYKFYCDVMNAFYR